MQGSVGTVAPLAQTISNISPREFGGQATKCRKAADQIAGVIEKCVSDGDLDPMQGWKLLSGCYATCFGYDEFHNEVTPSNLATVLLSEQQAQRELAGSRS